MLTLMTDARALSAEVGEVAAAGRMRQEHPRLPESNCCPSHGGCKERAWVLFDKLELFPRLMPAKKTSVDVTTSNKSKALTQKGKYVTVTTPYSYEI